jgi:hypothetical protein
MFKDIIFIMEIILLDFSFNRLAVAAECFEFERQRAELSWLEKKYLKIHTNTPI